MLKKTRFRTTSFMHLIIRVVYRQFYYIVSSIIFVLRINNANEQKIRIQPQSDLKLMSAKVDLNEEKECLKNTDESVPFSLKSPVIVLTDIIDNTRLFNEQPLKMRQCIVAHYKMIFSLLKRYGGHMVANEGDSFHLAFQHFENAIKFCKEFICWHYSEIAFFQVRVGVNKGKLCVRKFCGYKVYGEPIEEIQKFFEHSDGKRICIKKKLIEKYNIKPEANFCMH